MRPRSRRGAQHPHRENHGVQACELEAPLHLVGGFVVQDTVHPGFLFEHQPPEEEDRVWECLRDPLTQLHAFGHNLRTDRHTPVRGQPKRTSGRDVARQHRLRLCADLFDLLYVFKRRRVDHANGCQHEIFEDVWEQPLHRQQAVGAQALVGGEKRHIESSVSEKVRNTLIEYITTSRSTAPRVYHSASSAAPLMSSTPFCIVRRSDSWAKRCGSQESVDMFAMTRGPSMKPACAATKSRHASDASVTRTNWAPTAQLPTRKSPANWLARTAFMVRPASGVACTRR